MTGRKFHIDEKHTTIFIRHKTGWSSGCRPPDSHQGEQQNNSRYPFMPVEKCQGVDILFGRYIKGCIKGRIETLHHPLLLALILVMGLQEERTERRTEGQCVDRRNGKGYDQGHTERLEQKPDRP